jgi:hypothetical protein
MSKKIKPGVERVYLNGRVIRVVAQVEAARMLRDGKAEKVIRNGIFMGVEVGTFSQRTQERHVAKVDLKQKMASVLENADAMRSCVILSAAEVEAIAFGTKSRTEGMTESQRDSRVSQGFPEMDLPERARAKFHQLFGQLATA